MRFRLLLSTILLFQLAIFAQTPTAILNGRVMDPSKAVLQDVRINAMNVETGVNYSTETNAAGLFTLVNLPPGTYRVAVSKPGFRTIVQPSIVLHVQDVVALNFDMSVGSVAESITVEGGAPLVNTEDASVSTVVDRNFAENLPMNGRSFQTLIQLTPGVVTTQSNPIDGGQFSVNGQRPNSNYWMVDGVGANVGTSANFNAGNGLAGGLPSSSVLGGTNSLVSVDALQEFRIQTSTYAPEFGRSPGAQISILTRSGGNRFHGTAFDYVRNDVFDANDWFANHAGLPKPQERQNDFGGTFSGPIFKDKTFFFFSYEGLRLRLPQTALTTVPDLSARQNALPAMQPYLNAYPVPNGPELGNGIAEFNSTFSNKSSLDAYSLRIDENVNSKFSLFGRYNYSPSSLVQRGFAGEALSNVDPTSITTQTATIGATYLISPAVANDLRVNYSRSDGSGSGYIDDFGGAIPVPAPFPSPFSAANSEFGINIFSLSNTSVGLGKIQQNVQRQINVVDNLSFQKGAHSLKVGIDLRRLAPLFGAQSYGQIADFASIATAQTGRFSLSFVRSGLPATFLFRNLGVFAQDTWRATPHVTITYGLRWDVDFVPSSLSGPSLPAVTGFNVSDASNLALAPAGMPPFQTRYNNFAPRVGIVYQLSGTPGFERVIRGGFGVFYDLATQEVGNNITAGNYPFGAARLSFNGSFPLSPDAAAPPPSTPESLQSGTLTAFDPHLNLPYTLQWNVALEQSLGMQQSLSLSYVGSVGKRLIQSGLVLSPNPNFAEASLITNAGVSSYNALQVQFQRRLSHGLQMLAGYTWSHSIDTASGGSAFGNQSNALQPGFDPNINRGDSDFDVRQAFSVGLTYDLPHLTLQRIVDKVVNDWSFQSVIQARSAPPVTVFDSNFFELANASVEIRPDLVPGQPVYLYGAQYPGGRALNFNAFQDPPVDENGNPLRQGNFGRNAARAFGAFQWDLAIHRTIPLRESLKLEFRAEAFNVLNHPNFGPPVSDLANETQFGQAVQMLGQSLVGVGSSGSGAFDPLYQIGGPRSLQLALKLLF